MAVGLKSQIAEVKRELALRRNVYARETKPKKIAENELHMAHMAAVLKTLEWLLGNNVPDNLPNPGTVAAAMFYVLRLAGAVIVKPDSSKMRLAAIDEACRNALQGLPPPDMLSDEELDTVIEALDSTAAYHREGDAASTSLAKLKRMRAARRAKS